MLLHRLTRTNLQFVFGLALGVSLSFIMTTLQQMAAPHEKASVQDRPELHTRLRDMALEAPEAPEEVEDAAMLKMMLEESESGHHHAHELLNVGNIKAVKFEDLHAHHDDDTLAKKLSKQVRVLIWVMTGPQNLDKKAVHVRNTWGKRVNKLLFMSSVTNATFPTVGLNVSEGRQHLTAKTMQAFQYSYQHHYADADWFMKADDDTYVVVENLRYMLSAYNPQEAMYFGHHFNVIVKPQGYASGGAGYVLSKEALRRLVTVGVNNATLCRRDGGAEDLEMGRCLQRLGVRLAPSADRLGRSRFHCFGPEAHLQGSYPKWYLKYDALGAKKGMGNISDYPVTFHYMGANKMYAMEYFTYHLRPYGIISKFQDLN